MINKLFIQILTLVLFCTHFVGAQTLERRAHVGARFSGPANEAVGVTARSVESQSKLYKAGLRAKDRIIKIDGTLITDANQWSDLLYDFRGGQKLDLVVLRNTEVLELQVVLDPMPQEDFSGVDISYETVISDQGQEIRTIISKPKGSTGPMPALFLIGGLSCSSIEVYPGRPISGWTQVLQDLITKSNMVFMRVEKPGVGDSNGHCGCSDFNDDQAAFKAALSSLISKEYVDPQKLIIYGSSMGSALAPTFANQFNAAGVISDGTFVKSWFEHMLEIERRIRKFQGETPQEIMHHINTGYIPLYYGMLIEKKSYAQVIKEQPQLAHYNYHAPAHMYGRPVEYYHQVQDFNFAQGWQELKAPVRIIRGTNDWIMSDADNDLIIEILENSGHKDHQLYRYPGLDHWNMIHEKAQDSFEGKPGKWEDKISQIIIDFAWEMLGE